MVSQQTGKSGEMLLGINNQNLAQQTQQVHQILVPSMLKGESIVTSES